MNESKINALLENLKQPDEILRRQATHQLWKIWFEQKGTTGLEKIRQAEVWLQGGNSREAEGVLTQLIEDLPDFAEAWNRRAVLYYITEEYDKALADCKQVIELNPIHFGAIHGMGLCYAAMGDLSAAIRAFRQALEIQPYSVENQRLILECTSQL
ncbi:tetratricopeptide repeat family protein [Lyngbya aestuarii BL J]|uniref:Tetratricopeptide repeat family protein n=1 Tax=Lyngbya aestuarii BL J TaxID=1348334 RepID=U7QBV7_9CYAN|nr:tetratricopeptide repeat protein [Lyngbya aestuarii]ERT04490.1 tetratricopeptide repeat family protein [Lyngbya aestuarii BL J]